MSSDRKWTPNWTANDPRCRSQMIPPENEEWHGVCSRNEVLIFTRLALWAGKMNQILRCDWLPKRAKWSFIARSRLPVVSLEKNVPRLMNLANIQPFWPHTKSITHVCSIKIYIITQVFLAFLLILAYDVIEDRRTIDVIISKISPNSFKMAESFDHLYNIFLHWAKDKVQKRFAEALSRFEKQEGER